MLLAPLPQSSLPSSNVPHYCLLSRCSNEDEVTKKVDAFLTTTDCVQLYKAIFDALRKEYETGETRGILKKVGQ